MPPLPLPHANGDLRRLMRLIGAAIIFFGFLLLGIVAFTGWDANQSAADIERTLVDNALNRSIARALNEQKSVAWWDDSVVNITDEKIDLDFVDSNFGIFLTETYGHDEVYILNAENRPLYAFAKSERGEPSAFEARRADLEPIIAEARGADPVLKKRPDTFGDGQDGYRVLAGAVQIARWAGHIVSVEGRPAIVAALTIVPNVDMSLLKGTPNLLVTVTYVDEAFVSDIGRSLLLPDLALTPSPLQRDGVVSDRFVGDDGVLAGHLTWTTRRPGQVLLTIILPLVAFGVLGTGVLSVNILRRLRQATSALAHREAKARYESKHDALSALPNRTHMLERIDEFLHNRAVKNTDERAVVAYIDIDRFKDVNDTLGHEAGDRLIKLVAQRLDSRLRPQDFIARFGGDEFVILCTPAGEDGGEFLAERVAAALSSPFKIGSQDIRVTASVGIALAPDHGETSADLIRHADIALYEAKSRGRDRAVIFSPEMARQVEDRRSIELDLRVALETEGLRLDYQPIVSCRTGAIVGVESLVRWHHPVHGEMSPAAFIPIAESSGIMPELGEWILDRAMRDFHRWPNLEVSVNLSPAQFRQVDLEGTLRRLVAKHGIDPRHFVMEITEGVLLETTEHTLRILEGIQSMGFKTALDDFGTGYSSLAYLCNFKFNKIKIDRSFVSSMSQGGPSLAIVQSVIALGRALGMTIVAEGVETELEVAMMAQFGCNELQGFYFSKAVPADKLIELLKSYEPKARVMLPTKQQQQSVAS